MKTLYILAIILFTMTSSWSQDSGDMEFGFLAGVSMVNVSTIDGQDSAKSRIAFTGGFYGDYYFLDTWSLKLKTLYDQKGFAEGLRALVSGEIVKSDFSLHYITVPLTVNWHFGKSKNWYLNLGPYVGVLLSASASEGVSEVKDDFNRTDFGISSGLGVKFPFGDTTNIFIELDSQYGLSDIFKDNEGTAVRNGRMSLNLGINF